MNNLSYLQVFLIVGVIDNTFDGDTVAICIIAGFFDFSCDGVSVAKVVDVLDGCGVFEDADDGENELNRVVWAEGTFTTNIKFTYENSRNDKIE